MTKSAGCTTSTHSRGRPTFWRYLDAAFAKSSIRAAKPSYLRRLDSATLRSGRRAGRNNNPDRETIR